ncbi:MAG: hypothetical protein EXX96DRAFT_518941 [Benjaminiella poitrasii]|nr:MAG: hypothetical protein EXX96DRAFT_518941 [Benjaminiella poitrasii]
MSKYRVLLEQFKRDKGIWKKVIKCTIAYEIGSILVLIPSVHQNEGIVPFLIPLGTLFFNAGGTAGNQIAEILLDIIVIVPVCIWCAIFSYLCTVYNNHMAESSSSLYSNGAGIIASIAFFICLFSIGYVRMKYPRLATATLIGSVVPFFCLTKGIYNTHFNIMSVVGIFYPTLIGGGIALLVNLVVWPETAAKASEISFGDAFTSIQDALEYANTHLFNDENDTNNNIKAFGDPSIAKQLRQNIKKLDVDISQIKRAKNEAKYEVVISYYCPTWYKPIASIMEGLSRNFFGFMLAYERESQIMTQQKIGDQLLSSRCKSSEYCQNSIRMRQEDTDTRDAAKLDYRGISVLRIEYKLISHLQSSIQPEMKNFFQTSLEYTKAIRNRLEENQAIRPRKASIKGSYVCRRKELQDVIKSLQEAKIILQKEYEESHNPKVSEDHYLIYTVLFSLIQIGEKLFELDKEANILIERRKQGRLPTLFFPKVHFKEWLRKASDDARDRQTITDQIFLDQQSVLTKERSFTRQSSGSLSMTENAMQSVEDVSDTNENVRTLSVDESTQLQKSVAESDWIIGNEKIMTSLHNAPGEHKWNQWLYRANEWIQADYTRYAFKYALVMELLALMAWLPVQGVNTLYNENHGQWALLSAMIVVNFTVGSTVLLCLLRTLATIVGAVCAYVGLLAAKRNENPYVLAVLILVFQVPMWYMMLRRFTYSRMGFIALLTMAVIVATGYINTIQEDLFEPVWKRTLTAIFAIVLVLIVDQILWPVWARKMARRHLSDLLIATGIQFSKVASLASQEDISSPLYRTTMQDVQRNAKLLRGQHQLTSQMLVLAGLEPRVTKGKFPIDVYCQILDHEQNMLYWIEHLLTTQAMIPRHVRTLLMHPINPLRKELAAAVHLYLYTLAGALRTKSSLPASLPSAELARQLLQRRITQIMRTQFNAINGNESTEAVLDEAQKKELQIRYSENQIYWQTFAAGNVELIVEQEAIGGLVAKLMGQYVFNVATNNQIP